MRYNEYEFEGDIDNVTLKLTREQKEELIQDYLCNDQVSDYLHGETESKGIEIRWVNQDEVFQVIEQAAGETNITYESGGLEHTTARMSDELLDDVIKGYDLSSYIIEDIQIYLDDLVDEVQQGYLVY